MDSRIFLFRTSFDKEIYRDIEIAGSDKLSDLAEAICESFDFELDHCYGFFNNIKNMYKSTEKYELFADLEEGYVDEYGSKSVEETRIDDVFTSRKRMLFFFDYGDCWEFIAKCRSIKSEKEKGVLYPRVVLSEGEAPAQYPSFDDEYEEDIFLIHNSVQ